MGGGFTCTVQHHKITVDYLMAINIKYGTRIKFVRPRLFGIYHQECFLLMSSYNFFVSVKVEHNL